MNKFLSSLFGGFGTDVAEQMENAKERFGINHPYFRSKETLLK
jgi:hypothetical protein